MLLDQRLWKPSWQGSLHMKYLLEEDVDKFVEKVQETCYNPANVKINSTLFGNTVAGSKK